MAVRQLLPAGGDATVDDLLGGLDLAAHAPDGRPYLVLNMVASIDGRTTLGGHVGDLTSEVDQQIVYGLRAQGDALLVGAGTVRNERYGSLFPGGDQKPVVVVSGRVDLPADLPLLAEEDARIVIATTDQDAVLEFDHAASVDYLRLPGDGGRVDCEAMCQALRADYGVRALVCEGGPSLNEALISYAVVDELFLSLSPLLVGGGERTLVDTAPSHATRHARLVSVATADDYLFLRYAL